MSRENQRGKSWEHREKILKERVEIEGYVNDLLQKINHANPNPDALHQLTVAIPCILHLKMRVGIKMIFMSIMMGLGNASDDSLPWMQIEGKTSRSSNVRKDYYVKKFVKVVNQKILGTKKNPGQFKLNFESDR